MRAVLVLLAVATTGTNGFAPSAFSSRRSSSTQVQMSAEGEVSRTGFLKQMAGAAVAATLVGNPFAALAETLPSGVDVKVIKKGDGPIPDIGELAAIRFKAFAGDNKIDDIFDTPEPYYTRIGNGGLIKGVEDVLPTMRIGDRWELTIPGNLAFGPKGRPASAGKPRIPGDQTIIFEVEMVGLPGKEQELIDIIGD
eukprot:scaffold44731_cov48-Attheya_sp.AAC.4